MTLIPQMTSLATTYRNWTSSRRFVEGTVSLSRLYGYEYELLLRNLVEEAMGSVSPCHDGRPLHLCGHLSLALRRRLLAFPVFPSMSTFAPFDEPWSRWGMDVAEEQTRANINLLPNQPPGRNSRVREIIVPTQGM